MTRRRKIDLKISQKDKGKNKRVTSNKSGLNRNKIFQEYSIANIIREKILNIKKTDTKIPPLSKDHKQKLVKWSKKIMKTYFSTVIISDEWRATLE